MMCPDHELLSAFIDGEVENPWQKEIENHLQECPDCSQRVLLYRRLSLSLQEAEEPDYRPSMTRVKAAVALAPKIIQISKTPLWKKRLNLPLPAVAAAAGLIIVISVFFSINLANTGSSMAESENPLMIAEAGIPQDNDLATIIKLMENQDFNNEMSIQLPDDSRFSISGEPMLIKASDLNRSE